MILYAYWSNILVVGYESGLESCQNTNLSIKQDLE